VTPVIRPFTNTCLVELSISLPIAIITISNNCEPHSGSRPTSLIGLFITTVARMAPKEAALHTQDLIDIMFELDHWKFEPRFAKALKMANCGTFYQ
jgi:hypothetical protein